MLKLSAPPSPQPLAYIAPGGEPGSAPARPLPPGMRRPMAAGIGVVALLVLGFGGWSATAPIAGGAVAPGVISPDGSRKTIQHLEGGIIAEIMVRDGDFVVTGTPLLKLEGTQAHAVYELLLSQYLGLRATQARLTAEWLEHADIAFPTDLLAVAGRDEVAETLAVQRQLFQTRRDAHATRKRVLDQRIRQMRDQVEGLKAQLASSVARLRIVREELDAKNFLFDKQLLPKSQVLAVRRAEAEIEGDRGEYLAAIAQTEQKIGETELERVALDAVRADDIATQLDQVRGDLLKVREQLRASEDTLERTTIAAPVSGTVVDLRFKTRGGVIRPGEPIMDIVPANDDLLIDARIAPIDIDVVHSGLPAQVHLSAYKQRNLPRIEGMVRSVSADSLRDPQTGTAYYLARVEVDHEQLAGLADEGIHLVPGMPAEVLVVTGERTLLGYLLQPFRDVFRRSLREV